MSVGAGTPVCRSTGPVRGLMVADMRKVSWARFFAFAKVPVPADLFPLVSGRDSQATSDCRGKFTGRLAFSFAFGASTLSLTFGGACMARRCRGRGGANFAQDKCRLVSAGG